MSYGDRRRALSHAVAAVATAIALMAGLALLSRLRPGTFAGAATTSALLPGTSGRLSWPLNYWNALAAMVALGLPLLLAVATSARRISVQAGAAAAIPMTALCGYLTFSRGGAIATAVALLAFMALAPDRIPKLATLLVGAAGSAALIAGAVHRPAVEQGLGGALARHQGSTLIVAVALVCAGVGLAQVGIGLAARHGRLPRPLAVTPARARALLALAAVIAVGVAVAVHVPRRLDHAWHQFQRPEAANLHQNALGRYGALSGNGRYTYWKTALDALPGHSLRGWGPGTYQLVWLPRARNSDYVVNAHSLYIETLSDTGIVGLVLLVAFFVVFVAAAVRRVARSRFEARTQAAAVAAATCAFLTSAAFDWVWQVPVLPVAWLLLVAAALVPGSALHPAGRRPAKSAARAPERGGAWTVRAIVALGAVGCLVAIGVPLATTSEVRASQAAASAHDDAAALADAQTALRIEPGAVSAALQAALVLEQQRRFAAAVDDARAATRDEPANWQAWLLRSRMEAESGHPTLAVAAFERARTLNPQSPIFHS
jgi:O-antigen ligase